MLPPPCAPPQGVDGDASVHDRVLWALHISGMDDLLKFLASTPAEQQWALHVLEIVSLMFRDQVGVGGAGPTPGPHPAMLNPPPRRARSSWQRWVRGGQAPSAGRRRGSCRVCGSGSKQSRERGHCSVHPGGKGAGGEQNPVVGPALLISCVPPSRHSRFRGSYVIQGLKAIGEHDVVFHKGLHNVSMGMGSTAGGSVRRRGARSGAEGAQLTLSSLPPAAELQPRPGQGDAPGAAASLGPP